MLGVFTSKFCGTSGASSIVLTPHPNALQRFSQRVQVPRGERLPRAVARTSRTCSPFVSWAGSHEAYDAERGTLVAEAIKRVLRGRCNSEPAVIVPDQAAAIGRVDQWK